LLKIAVQFVPIAIKLLPFSGYEYEVYVNEEAEVVVDEKA